MIDGNVNPRMSQETFEGILDVTGKDFAALSIPDCDSEKSECKLTRAGSFSEVETVSNSEGFLRKKSFEKFIEELGSEELLEIEPSARQIKASEVVKFVNDDLRRREPNPWNKIPLPVSLLEIDSPENPENPAENMDPEEKELEYMEVEDIHTDNKSAPISSPARYSSRIFIQSTPALPSGPDKKSSVTFRSNLRSSRSDISNLHSDDKRIFEVSKSFGQFTFRDKSPSESIDFKEIPPRKPQPSETLSQDQNATEEIKFVKPEIEKTKKKLRPLMQEKKTKSYSCSCWQIIFFLLLPVTVVLVSTILNQQEKFCEPSFNFTNVTLNLPKFVHGQNQGVADLIKSLQSDPAQFKIIALVGGTGVGKSHVANIIKNSLPKSYYAFEYFPPLYNKVRQVYSALSTCQCNIIILENLGTEDISDAAFFSQALRNRAANLCVLMVELFNTQITDNDLRRSMDLKGSVERIEDGFRKEGIEMRAVGFEPLTEESIMKCIMDAVEESHFKLSEKDIQRVRRSLLVANSGCKGAYSKVQLLGKVPK
ncbi:uncharacterized protein LOC117177138 [Belonocnema kinseyi]|uniref:uncharacterized protein LOC117177138 n=1 Tax=Belonocnema kinseyi TaxID=2817044 RepID=UPI00143D35B8|nr:uncharacterized protein LOC117177138 [Belonocnema kinseyi]